MVCILVGERKDKLHLVRPCGQAGAHMHCLHLGEQHKDKLHSVPLGRREGKMMHYSTLAAHVEGCLTCVLPCRKRKDTLHCVRFLKEDADKFQYMPFSERGESKFL